jgi:hypothetical protein
MPFDSYTKLLSHFNGTNGQNTYTAETGQTITFVGTAQLSTAQKKFGTASLAIDGDSDYVTVPDSEDWDFGTGDFTIDFWIRFNSVATTQVIVYQSLTTLLGDEQYIVWDSVSNKIYCFDYLGDYGGYFSTPWSPSINTWYHIAWVRNGSTCFIFINGVAQSVTTVQPFGTMHNFNSTLTIGRTDRGAGNYVNGYIDELRISKGIARWTANFTPPTAEYYSIGGTQGLIL